MDGQDHRAGGEQGLSGNLSVSRAAPGGYYEAASGGGADYYAAGAGREGKEPEGTWAGDGCRDLGLEPGSVIGGDAFKTIYDNHVDPRDGSRIGRALTDQDVHQLYAGMLNGEPGATAERRQELYTQAQARAAKTQSVRAWDATFEPGKSITLLHASARAMRLAAEESGDKAQAQEAQRIEDAVWRAISDGAAAGMAHLQAHAGYTRTGAGGVRKEDAHGWVVANWRQHTSSRWGSATPSSTRSSSTRWAPSGTASGGPSTAGSVPGARGSLGGRHDGDGERPHRDLGVQWVQRADGHGREIKRCAGPHGRVLDQGPAGHCAEASRRLRWRPTGRLLRPRPGRARVSGRWGAGGEPGEPGRAEEGSGPGAAGARLGAPGRAQRWRGA